MHTLGPADVQQALEQANLDIQIMIFDTSTATSEQAADRIGCELGQIVKSLCFIINKAQAVVVLTSGDQSVDDKKLARLFEIGRKKIRMAKPDQCINIFGYAPGAVPPIGHRTPNLPIYMDESFQRYERVYAAAGADNSIFPIELTKLIEITGAVFADVVRD